MTTEELNEYIFASMVNDIAQRNWKKEARKLEDSGVSEGEAWAIPLSREHIRQAIELLSFVRSESVSILKESEKASQQ